MDVVPCQAVELDGSVVIAERGGILYHITPGIQAGSQGMAVIDRHGFFGHFRTGDFRRNEGIFIYNLKFGSGQTQTIPITKIFQTRVRNSRVNMLPFVAILESYAVNGCVAGDEPVDRCEVNITVRRISPGGVIGNNLVVVDEQFCIRVHLIGLPQLEPVRLLIVSENLL